MLVSAHMGWCAEPEGTTTNPPPKAPFAGAGQPLRNFQVKRGFRLELVAAEPIVAAPAAMAFDENGRLFVAEMRDYPQGDNQRAGRVRLLEDTDGDGIFDSSTIYADNLHWPSAIACYGGGVFVAATPEIIYLKDGEGHGEATERRTVFNGFGGETNRLTTDALLNSFNWGLDNRIHGGTAGVGGLVNALRASSGGQLDIGGNDFSFDPKGLSIGMEAGPAQSGMSFDSRGRRFIGEFIHPLRVVMLETRYLSRNPYFPKPPALGTVAAAEAPVYRFISSEPARAGDGSLGTNRVAPIAVTRGRSCLIYRGARFRRFTRRTYFFAILRPGSCIEGYCGKMGWGCLWSGRPMRSTRSF